MIQRIRTWAPMIALVVAGEAIFALPFVLPRVFRPALLGVLEIDNTALGAAFSVYGMVAMAAYLFGGPLADRFSARWMMAAALVSTAAGGVWLAAFPGPTALMALYGMWGLTTILLFWSGMIRATREWGGAERQGLAYGLLDGGRGLCGALLATAATAVFAGSLADGVAVEARASALRAVMLWTSGFTVVAAGLVLAFVPDPPPAERTRWSPSVVWALARRPLTWVHGVIVVCAYVGYKGTDDLSLLAQDVWRLDDVESAMVGTLAFWVRPVAAVGAGVLADRFCGHQVVLWGFLLAVVGNLAVAAGAWGPITAVVFTGIVSTCVAVYALRGVYFALVQESRVPVAWTGTAVGLVSVVGYTPDVFFGPLMGVILDGNPGVLGHQYLFSLLAGFSAVGAVAAWVFGRQATIVGAKHD